MVLAGHRLRVSNKNVVELHDAAAACHWEDYGKSADWP